MKKKKVTIKEEVNYDPYEEIANAIIIQASSDYKKAYKRSLKKGENDAQSNAELAELEEFFCSYLYKKLTYVDGEALMERLKKEVEKGIKKA